MTEQNRDSQENFIRKILSKEGASLIAILSIAFGVFTFVVNPQRTSEAQIEYLKLELEKNQALNDTLTKTQQNDLHTLEAKMAAQEGKMDDLKNSVVELKTIIQERIPPKK